MKIKELHLMIEKKRKELNKLAVTNLSSLCTEDIIKISNELDTLIATYLKLYRETNMDQDSN